MKFVYFNLMPYTDLTETGTDWPVANRRWDSERGQKFYRDYIENLTYAEACGFDYAGVNEHHMSPYGLMANPNLVAAHVMAKAPKIGFAVLGNLLPLLNPLRVAEEFAMLDVMSGGKVVAGLMRGIPHEYVAYNVPPDESYGRVEEAVRLIKKCWTETEPFGWEGEHYQFRAISIWPRPVPKPHPRIVMSGSSIPSAELAGRLGATLGLSNIISMPHTRQLIDAYMRSAKDSGWTPEPSDIILGFPTSISEDAAEAEATLTEGRRFFTQILAGGTRTAQRIVLQKSRFYSDETRNKFVDMGKAAAPTVKSLVDEGAILCGTPEMVVEQLKRVRAEIPFGTAMVSMKIGNVPDPYITKAMTLFRDRVLPHVRGL